MSHMKELFIAQTPDKLDEIVEIYGWVDTKRDHKKVIFLDLRDRTGIIQAVGDEKLREISTGDVVKATGLIKKRPERLINPKIPTGTIEMEIQNIETHQCGIWQLK